MAIKKRPRPWYGKVSDDGTKVELYARTVFRRYLHTLAGQLVALILIPHKKQRSSSQNAYWWAVVVPAFAEACHYGEHEHDAVHDELMRLLVGMREDSHPEFPIRVSSRDLSTDEFNKLIEAAQLLAADKLGIVIEDPDPDWARRRYEQERKRNPTAAYH